MYNIKRLRLLREVSLRGTLAAAAQALGYNPSSVSHQLKLLEQETGAELLEPVGRGVRLTAEAPAADGPPPAGRITDLVLPGGPGVRVDSHVRPGDRITPFTGPLLAEVVAGGRNRDQCLRRLRRALAAVLLPVLAMALLGALLTPVLLWTALVCAVVFLPLAVLSAMKMVSTYPMWNLYQIIDLLTAVLL